MGCMEMGYGGLLEISHAQVGQLKSQTNEHMNFKFICFHTDRKEIAQAFQKFDNYFNIQFREIKLI